MKKEKNYMKIASKMILIIILLLTFCVKGQGVYSLNNDSKNILILNSYSRDYTWTSGLVQEMVGKIKGLSNNVNVNIEFIDLESYSKDYNIKLIKDKYKEDNIQAVITTDEVALNFTMNNRDEIFNENTPVIFNGVCDETVQNITEKYKNVTGVIERLNIKDTLEEALKIKPEAENVYFIHDETTTGNNSFKEAKENLDLLSKDVNLIEVKDIEMDNLDNTLPSIGEDSIVVLSEYSRTPSGHRVYSEQMMKALSSRVNTPIFQLYNIDLGHKALGGNLMSTEKEGEATVKLLEAVLSKGTAEGISIVDELDTTSTYNYEVMMEYGISETKVPDDSEIINSDSKSYIKYKNIIYDQLYIIVGLFSLIIFMIINIRKRMKAEAISAYNEQKYKCLFEAANEGLWEVDLQSGERTLSTEWFRHSNLEIDRGENNGVNSWLRRVHPEDCDNLIAALEKVTGGDETVHSVTYRILTSKGEYRWITTRGKGIKDKNGDTCRLIGSHSDVHDRKVYEDKINKMAFSDALTGIANRAELVKRFNEIMEKGNNCTLLILDLDNFKNINDSFGHSIGDKFLVEITNKLKKCISHLDVLARFGGDEFLILINGVIEKSKVEVYLNNILRELEEKIVINELNMVTSASIGVAIYPDTSENFEELFKNADAALYKAKEYGKRNYVFFEKWMNEDVVEKVRIEEALRVALDKNEFVLHFQPKYNISKSRIDGFEALIRLNSSKIGFIPPLKFIDIAEKTGLIIPIGKWVLENACRFIKRVHEKGYNDLSVSVNVSVIQLLQKDFVDTVKEVIEKSGVDPKHIEIEITESILMESIDNNMYEINELKNLGVKIALDDFGKGYSSLAYLKDIPADVLKVDKSFIHEVSEGKRHGKIMSSIIKLAHNMDFEVVAEGVETQGHFRYLKENDCDLLQGYYIAKPMIEEEAIEVLSKSFEYL